MKRNDFFRKLGILAGAIFTGAVITPSMARGYYDYKLKQSMNEEARIIQQKSDSKDLARMTLEGLSIGYSILMDNQDSQDSLQESEREEPEIIDTPVQRYPDFRFPERLDTILFQARRYGINPAYGLAVLEAENGGPDRQFGIIPNELYLADRGYVQEGVFHEYPDDDGFTKQTCWFFATFRNISQRYDALPQEVRERTSLIRFAGPIYAPRNADNDPTNLNENWIENVEERYNIHIGN